MSSFTQEPQTSTKTDYRSNLYRSPERLMPIIQGLLKLPNYWKLIPCIGKKPLGRKWQQNYFSPQVLFHYLSREGKVWVKGKQGLYPATPNGYSLLCGKIGDRYLVAIDCDSIEALNKVKAMGFPLTVSYSSGRPGHRQFLYYVDRPIKSFKLNNGLEVRGQNLLSTLPTSVHPLTGRYHWLIAPDRVEIPTISSIWLNNLRPKPKPKIGKPITHRYHGYQEVEELIDAISPVYANVYDDWIRVGMALKDWNYNLLWLWDRWSQSSSKYKPGECAYKWASFNGTGITYRTIYYYAKIS